MVIVLDIAPRRVKREVKKKIMALVKWRKGGSKNAQSNVIL